MPDTPYSVRMHTEARPAKELFDDATGVAAQSVTKRIALALFSLVLFAATLELSLGAMQRFSFPYLPLFRADAALGVTLQPNASARVRTRDGHITTVRTNAQGFRSTGQVERAPVHGAGRRVLIVGDSQAMGLHVEGHETLGVALESALGGGTVLTLAVPTYGPIEYAMVVERFARALKADDVIVLFASANDYLEARVPNRARTTAALGFAARITHAVDDARGGEGHSWSARMPDVLGRSHVLYAARRILGTASADATVVDAPHLLARIGNQLQKTDTRGAKTDDAARPFASRLGPSLARIANACAEAQCRVHASVLPLDVEIEAGAWSKYTRGRADADLDATHLSLMEIARALREAAHVDMRALGISAVELTPALQRAAPGVFLPDDDHLSPRGHAAVARALQHALQLDDARALVTPAVKEPT
jgi:lysophospholipase L1-like esterase